MRNRINDLGENQYVTVLKVDFHVFGKMLKFTKHVYEWLSFKPAF